MCCEFDGEGLLYAGTNPISSAKHLPAFLVQVRTTDMARLTRVRCCSLARTLAGRVRPQKRNGRLLALGSLS